MESNYDNIMISDDSLDDFDLTKAIFVKFEPSELQELQVTEELNGNTKKNVLNN